jgi:ABC-type uncharacterized transport system auxiliary subunit
MSKTVLEPGSLIEPTHLLEGNVLVLHGDLRDRDLPQAAIQIRIFLVANKRSGLEVVFTQDYRAAHEAEARTADALVTAFDRCLEQILSALEQDLEKVL